MAGGLKGGNRGFCAVTTVHFQQLLLGLRPGVQGGLIRSEKFVFLYLVISHIQGVPFYGSNGILDFIAAECRSDDGISKKAEYRKISGEFIQGI